MSEIYTDDRSADSRRPGPDYLPLLANVRLGFRDGVMAGRFDRSLHQLMSDSYGPVGSTGGTLIAVRYRAVCCDLLTALVDSWSLWEAVAGNPEVGRRWRLASLRIVTESGEYRPYEPVVEQAAAEVGLDDAVTARLLARWETLMPYPDVRPALECLGLPIVIVTNTSQRLAEQAAARLGVPLHIVVSAESAGWYKPDRRAYKAGWNATGAASAEECLFVAGSPHDAAGATAAGHDVFWVNRRGAVLPDSEPHPRWQAASLQSLADTVSH